MFDNKNINWKDIYNCVLECGNMDNLESFSAKVLSEIKKICDFDQGLVYYFNAKGEVYNQYLMNIEKQWSTIYIEYYSKIEDGLYGYEKKVTDTINIRDWKKEPPSEFISNYIYSRGLRYSLGFSLFDMNNRIRTLYAIDRTRVNKFTDTEINTLYLTVPQLNNLHRKFFISQEKNDGSWNMSILTEREKEIVNLLCQGISPDLISKTLYISRSTAYKHMASIYEKLQVSTVQELLVRLLR